MNLSNANVVLLAKAIEEQDREAQWIGALDLRRISRETASSSDPIVARARAILALIPDRETLLTRLQQLTRFPAGIGWSALALAFLLGLLSNRLGPARVIDILSFPLLGLIALNLLLLLRFVLWNGWTALRPKKSSRVKPASPPPFPHNLIESLALKRLKKADAEAAEETPPLTQRVLRQAVRDHLSLGRDFHLARLNLWLHGIAGAIALGLIGGMYLRGLALEYQAGWESTFLNPAAVHQIYQSVFGPVAWLGAPWGVQLPSLTLLEQIRLIGGEPAGGELVSAAPFIHLFALAAAVYLIIPRVILGGYTGARLHRFTQGAFPLRTDADPYFTRLQQHTPARDEEGVALVVPHSFSFEGIWRDTLREMIADTLGPRMVVRFAGSIAYGDEESAFTGLEQDAPASLLILVFPMSATPEAEIQGELLSLAQSQMRQGRLAQRLLVAIDTSRFRERLSADPAFPKRLEERTTAWRRLTHAQGLEPLIIDLAHPEKISPPTTEELGSRLWAAV